jgi:hypothetical protein
MLTHLKTILNRRQGEHDPGLESHKHFHSSRRCHRTEAEGNGIFPNEATAIEFSAVRCLQKLVENPGFDPVEKRF